MAKKKFSVNDVVALTHYVKINSVNSDGSLEVSDLEHKNLNFKIKGDDILNSMNSANYYTKTEKVSQTELAQKLSEAYGKPFTVKFTKADKTERVLVGKLLSHEPLMGRCHVHDFEVSTGSPLRLVDNRNIINLIVDGVKYEVK